MRYMTLGEAFNLSEEFSLLICKAGITTYAFEATVTDHCAVTQGYFYNDIIVCFLSVR